MIQTVLAVLFIAGLIYRLNQNKKNVCIVVLGDIGRSPRMQYHAKSYAEENFRVNILGFKGSDPLPSLSNDPNVSFTYLSSPPKIPNWVPGFVYYILKTMYQALQLFFVLFFNVEKPGRFLVQNPPSIPTLSVVWMISCIKGSLFIIDWHNYAYSILSLNVKNDKHLLVRFAKWYEGFFGKFANENICVTKAMKEDLKMKWNINVHVLYDRPPVQFKETLLVEKHTLFLKLSKDDGDNDYGCKDFKGLEPTSTIFTERKDNKIQLRQDRPAVIISSTSWTEDEDFSILLNALEMYENMKNDCPNLPKLICIITGKGPLKRYYQKIIGTKGFKHITIVTPWLSPEDYPKIIGSGDLGVCLHTSSSGLDLPMKVVDMFGCGLPVCAVSFSCLDELVKHDYNGLVFRTSKELAEQMVDLLTGFPNQCGKLKSFRDNLFEFQQHRWHNNWKDVMLLL